MKPPFTRRQVLTLMTATACVTGGSALAQVMGTGRLTIVVPFAAAGPNDMLGRALGDQLKNQMAKTVIIENRPGAGSLIAAELVSRAPPDGNTILLATQATLVVNPVLYKKLPYDPVKSFQPVALLSEIQGVLVVRSSLPVKSVGELLERIRHSPKPMSFGSAGAGTLHHLAGELLKSTENLQLIHVPYKGSAPAVLDLLGGTIDMMFVDYSTIAGHIKDGTLRPLAVSGSRRLVALPNVPTASEAGLRSFALTAWQVAVVPAGTPREVVENLNLQINTAMRKLAADERFSATGIDVRGDLSVPQTADFIKTQGPLWRSVIERSGATAD